MLQSIRDGAEIDQATVSAHKLALDNELHNPGAETKPVAVAEPSSARQAVSSDAGEALEISGWTIAFSRICIY